MDLSKSHSCEGFGRLSVNSPAKDMKAIGRIANAAILHDTGFWQGNGGK